MAHFKAIYLYLCERKEKSTHQWAFGLAFCLASPKGHAFRTAWDTMSNSSNVYDFNITGNVMMPRTLDIVYAFDYIDLVI